MAAAFTYGLLESIQIFPGFPRRLLFGLSFLAFIANLPLASKNNSTQFFFLENLITVNGFAKIESDISPRGFLAFLKT